VRDVSYYDERAHGLLAVLPDGTPAVLEQVRTWHPAFTEATDDGIRSAPFTPDDARLVYARQHGFPSWARFVAHVEQLGDDPEGEPFLAVFESATRGDWPRATAILQSYPELVRALGTNGNTLLNLACSLVPCVAPGATPEARADDTRLAAVKLLLAAGADVQQANDRGWTPLHQAAYRNDPAMAALLLQSGARHDVSAHGDGGTPLVVALFWGHREVSAVLAERGAIPGNLRVAAGLGRPALVQSCVNGAGGLTAAARAGRSFYRPHSGFPLWQPSDDTQEILDEALVWAAKSNRTNVMPRLVVLGARMNADPYRGTPLLWAAANGHREAASWLLDHGADVNQRATFGGPAHGEGVTALHLAAQSDHAEMVTLLLSRGADATIRDALYESTPAGWAEHEGARRALTALLT
jgi:ankyrin repeat protein